MSIILLILGILILISKKSSLKNSFKSKKQLTDLLIKNLETAKETMNQEKDIFNIAIGIGMILISLLYILFYLFSAIFISNFWFAIISILMIFETIRVALKAYKYIKDMSKTKIESFFYRFFMLTIDFGYIGFVFYMIYTKW